MSLQNVMHRRKFLERSALGVGGVLFSSMLLQSCTDHAINPDPNTPVIIPPLTGSEGIDWNNDAKLVVTAALRQIPEVGGFISTMFNIVWPSSGNGPWDQVRAQVEALVDKKLDDDDYNRVTANLAGLSNVITDYKNALTAPVDYEQVRTLWRNAYTDFDLYQPNFQQLEDEVLLLPLFAQFANLYLGLLRDAVVYGQSWGMTDGEIQTYAGKCADKITEFTTYTTKWYNSGRAALSNKAPDELKVEPFRSTNAYDRDMTMLVLDYMDSWPYYDINKYPNGAKNPDNTPILLFTREIYSDPFGNIVSGWPQHPVKPINLPSPATQFPTQITVWGGSRVDAVQLTYPAGGGSGGVTITPRMGDSNGGSSRTYAISPDQPITQAQVTVDRPAHSTDESLYVSSLQFILSNGTGLPGIGQPTPVSIPSGIIGYDKYALSSIYIQGTNIWDPNSSVDCIVFGFMRWPRS